MEPDHEYENRQEAIDDVLAEGKFATLGCDGCLMAFICVGDCGHADIERDDECPLCERIEFHSHTKVVLESTH